MSGFERSNSEQRKSMQYGLKRAEQWYRMRPTALQKMVLEMAKHYLQKAKSDMLTEIPPENP